MSEGADGADGAGGLPPRWTPPEEVPAKVEFFPFPVGRPRKWADTSFPPIRKPNEDGVVKPTNVKRKGRVVRTLKGRVKEAALNASGQRDEKDQKSDRSGRQTFSTDSANFANGDCVGPEVTAGDIALGPVFASRTLQGRLAYIAALILANRLTTETQRALCREWELKAASFANLVRTARTAVTFTASNSKEIRALLAQRFEFVSQSILPMAATGDPVAVRAAVNALEAQAKFLGLTALPPNPMGDATVPRTKAEMRSYLVDALAALDAVEGPEELPPATESLVTSSADPVPSPLESTVPTVTVPV